MKLKFLFIGLAFVAMGFYACEEHDKPNSELFTQDGKPKSENNTQAPSGNIQLFKNQEVNMVAEEFQKIAALYQQASTVNATQDMKSLEEKKNFILKRIEELRPQMSEEEKLKMDDIIKSYSKPVEPAH